MKFNSTTLFLVLLAYIFSSCKTEDPVIIPDVQKIVLDKTDLTLTEGDSVTLAVTFEPVGATENLIWTSSNEKVATVNSKGIVKALSRGYALIKAQGDSLYASCNVNVTRTDLAYQLVWSEEFDGTTLDLTKWNIETGGGGWGNNEKQYYTNRSENLRLEGGSLIIEAKKEVYQSNKFTSARINSRDKVAYT